MLSPCFSDGFYRIANSDSQRFDNGMYTIAGRLEVCYNGTFASVCDAYWDDEDAATFCRDFTRGIGFGELVVNLMCGELGGGGGIW